jgi:NTE family protein
MFGLRWLRPKPPPWPRRIDLALQGGGSHGAFTWGVLDRLLRDDGLDVRAISGTSAGALNAGVLATGFARGGRDGARAALSAFWLDVSRAGQSFAPFSRAQMAAQAEAFNVDQLPAYQWFASFFRAFSPYEFNPLDVNPLRDIVRRHVDEAALRDRRIALFITATHVATGRAHVFSGDALSVDALLASACLPFLFRAVEVDGEAYWDGGYTGNPALWPLVYRSAELDVLLVKINPLRHDGLPTRAVDIIDRVAEISFNASLVGEMRAIDFVARLLQDKRLDPRRYKALRLHMIGDEGLATFGAASKLDTDRAFLERLFALGDAAADAWLAQHREAIGVRGTLDVERTFLRR